MLYLGLDVHSKWTTINGFDSVSGQTVFWERINNDRDSFEAVLGSLEGPLCGAMETGTSCWSIYRMLAPFFEKLLVVDPVEVWGRKVRRGAKTDARDAMTLAVKLSRGELCGLYVPDEQTQDLRSLGRAKIQATQLVTKLNNEIWSLLKSWGFEIERSLLSKQGDKFLEEAASRLPEHTARVLEMWTRMLHEAQAVVAELQERIEEAASNDEVCQKLMTIPCVGEFTALVMRAEIGDIRRFASARHLVSYCGLCPTLSMSAGKGKSGRLSKACNHALRYVFALRGKSGSRLGRDNPLSQTYWRTAIRHSPNDGGIAVARQLVRVVYAMMKNGTDWNPEHLHRQRQAAEPPPAAAAAGTA